MERLQRSDFGRELPDVGERELSKIELSKIGCRARYGSPEDAQAP